MSGKRMKMNRANGKSMTRLRQNQFSTIRSIVIILIPLLFVCCFIAPVSAISDEKLNPANKYDVPAQVKAPIKTADQQYMEWARVLLSNHPEVKTMSEMEKAQFAFNAYTQDLQKANLKVNSNLGTRLGFTLNPGTSYGDHTCGWHTSNLQIIMRTLGVKEVHSITADKDSMNLLDVNRNHQAVLVMIDGIPKVFDIWKMAVEHEGEYGAPSYIDPNNGMDLDQWAFEMNNIFSDTLHIGGDKYKKYSVDDEANPEDVYYSTPQEALKHIKLTYSTTKPAPSSVSNTTSAIDESLMGIPQSYEKLP